MASIIKIKRSSSASSVPGSLQEGELAVNLFDRKLYVGNSTGVTAIAGENAIADVAGLQAALDNRMTVANTQSLVNARLGATASVTLTGDITGTASFSGNSVSISTTYNNDVVLGTDTSGNYVETLAAGNNSIVITGADGEGATKTVSLGDNIGANTSGTAASATALATARDIGGVSFDGTANINLPGVNTTGNQDTTGNAATATALETARNIAGQSFDGTADITIAATDLSDVNQSLATTDNVTFADISATGDLTVDGNLTVEGAVTYISSSTVNVDDSMLKLSANNAGDTVDTGVYGKYIVSGNSAVQFAGYFRDATDGAFKFYTGLDVEPTTTVDVTDTGYGLAQVDAIIDGGTY